MSHRLALYNKALYKILDLQKKEFNILLT